MPIALDCESVASDAPPQRLVSVAIAYAQSGAHLFHHTDPRLFEIVCRVFDSGVILAFAPVDVCLLLRKWPELLHRIIAAYNGCRVHDVLTREKKIDIAQGMHRRRGGYDLDAVSYRRGGVVLEKSELAAPHLRSIGIVCPPDLPIRLAFGYLYDVPIERWPAAFKRYALLDPIGTLSTFEQQEKFRAAHTHDVFACSPIEAMAHLPLYFQTLRGIDTDQAWVDSLSRDIDAEVHRLEQILLANGLARVEGGGPRSKKPPKITKCDQVARDMMARTGRAKKPEPGKKVSIDAKSLKSAMLPPDHLLRLYANLGSLQAIRSKNIAPLRHAIVRTRYDECVSTGRTSSSAPDDGDDGTNWQNLPRPPEHKGADRIRDLMGRFRGCLVPPRGYVFGISDLGGAELVTFADTEICWFGDSEIGKALIAGRKPHSIFACDLLGIREDQLDREHNDTHQEMYQIAKIKNFGSLGGMGPPSFQQHLFSKIDLLQPIEVTRQQHKLWLQRWKPQRYFDKINSLAGPDRRITIVEPRTGFVRGNMVYTEACNFPFQSKAALAAKLGIWRIWLATLDPHSPLYGCWGCLFVHDENVSCLPIAVAEAALAEQNRIMIDSFAAIVPSIPIKVDGKLAERYGK